MYMWVIPSCILKNQLKLVSTNNGLSLHCRQKQTISRLQQECREYEARMKQLTLSRSLEEAGVIGIRLQVSIVCCCTINCV